MREQPHLLERGQLVPNGRGRDAQAVAADERSRGDGLRAGDVLADHGAQQLALSFSELRERLFGLFLGFWHLALSL